MRLYLPDHDYSKPTWRGTQGLQLDYGVIEALVEVSMLYTRDGLSIPECEISDKEIVTLSVAAIRVLELSDEVLYPVSLEKR